jgi:arylsulfatase A-like enzyme
MPTLLEQLRLPGVEGIQGTSMLPYLGGGSPVEPVMALGEAVKLGPEQKALYRGDWKLMYVEDEPPRCLLYNVTQDPSEQTDCSGQDPARLSALLKALMPQLAENGRLSAGVQAIDTPMSPEWRRQLEALGYVGGASDDDDPNGDSDSPPPP